jgi:hypothetical protein
MKILIEDFPFEQLGLLGLHKEKVLNLDSQTLTALMQGGMTNVLALEVIKDNHTFLLEAKLQLNRLNDKVDVAIYPVRNKIDNSQFKFSDDELLKLYAGKIVKKNFEGERNFFQLDRETFNVFRAKAADINIPFDMDTKTREKLLLGNYIDVQTEKGVRRVKLDFFSPNRFVFESEKVNLRYYGSHFQDTELLQANIFNYKIKEADVQRLLDGQRTSLVELENGQKGKIGLHRDETGRVLMQFYSVKDSLYNDIQLTAEQIQKLQRGEMVTTHIGGKAFIVQMDNETNELMRKQLAHVDTGRIRGLEVSNADRERLLTGQSVTIKNDNTGELVTERINLNHENGLEIKNDKSKLKTIYTAGNNANQTLEHIFPNKIDRDGFMSRNLLNKGDLENTARAAFDLKQRMDYDFHHVGYAGALQTDRNYAELHAFILSQHTQVNTIKI